MNAAQVAVVAGLEGEPERAPARHGVNPALRPQAVSPFSSVPAITRHALPEWGSSFGAGSPGTAASGKVGEGDPNPQPVLKFLQLPGTGNSSKPSRKMGPLPGQAQRGAVLNVLPEAYSTANAGATNSRSASHHLLFPRWPSSRAGKVQNPGRGAPSPERRAASAIPGVSR